MGTTHQVLAGKLGGGAGGTVKETLPFRPEGLVTDLQLYVHPQLPNNSYPAISQTFLLTRPSSDPWF